MSKRSTANSPLFASPIVPAAPSLQSQVPGAWRPTGSSCCKTVATISASACVKAVENMCEDRRARATDVHAHLRGAAATAFT